MYCTVLYCTVLYMDMDMDNGHVTVCVGVLWWKGQGDYFVVVGISSEPQLLRVYKLVWILCWTALMRANKLKTAVPSMPFCSGPPDFFHVHAHCTSSKIGIC